MRSTRKASASVAPTWCARAGGDGQGSRWVSEARPNGMDGARPCERGDLSGRYRSSSTACACPSTFTFGYTFAILPSSSITNVVRSIALKIFPYMLLSTSTPNALHTLPSGSDKRVKGSSYLDLNFAWAETESLLIPITSAFFFSNAATSSRKSQASRVQPGVSALGKKNRTTRRPFRLSRERSLPSSVLSVKAGALMPASIIALSFFQQAFPECARTARVTQRARPYCRGPQNRGNRIRPKSTDRGRAPAPEAA